MNTTMISTGITHLVRYRNKTGYNFNLKNIALVKTEHNLLH